MWQFENLKMERQLSAFIFKLAHFQIFKLKNGLV